jgi:hypothetical protein
MDVYFNDIELQIIRTINKAKERLLIAVAWFTSDKISDSIILLFRKGIDIEILVDDNHINRNSPNIARFTNEGIDIDFIKDFSKKSHIMHNKFCIVDNSHFLTGSYNWTENAKSNDENIVIIQDKEISNLYSLEFRRIKRNDNLFNQIDFKNSDASEIVKLFVQDIKKILSKGVSENKLELNAINKLNNPKVNSLIRKTLELTTINTKDMVGKIFVYQDLIREHGIFYEKYAKPEDLAACRDKHKKEGMKDFDTHVEITLIHFKLQAIQKLLKEYIILIEKVQSDENKITRVVKVFMYLNKEKLRLFEKRKQLQ